MFCVPITLFKIEFIANTDKPDVIIFPTAFNVAIHVDALFNVVFPDIFIDDVIVVLLFNVVKPDTFNDDNNVVLLFNVETPDRLAGSLRWKLNCWEA